MIFWKMVLDMLPTELIGGSLYISLLESLENSQL